VLKLASSARRKQSASVFKVLAFEAGPVVNVCGLRPGGSLESVGIFADVDLQLVHVVFVVDGLALVWLLVEALNKLDVSGLARQAETVCSPSVALRVAVLVPFWGAAAPTHRARKMGRLCKVHVKHTPRRL
jgi:hypothetical protein